MPGVARMLAAADEAGVSNLWVHPGDAMPFLTERVAPASLRGGAPVLPGPVAEEEAREAAVRAAAHPRPRRVPARTRGGLRVATDIAAYAAHARAQLAHHGRWDVVEGSGRLAPGRRVRGQGRAGRAHRHRAHLHAARRGRLPGFSAPAGHTRVRRWRAEPWRNRPRARPCGRASAARSISSTRPAPSRMTPWAWSRWSTWLTEGPAAPHEVGELVLGHRDDDRPGAGGEQVGQAQEAPVHPAVEADGRRLGEALAQLAHPVGEQVDEDLGHRGVALAQLVEGGGAQRASRRPRGPGPSPRRLDPVPRKASSPTCDPGRGR